MSSLTSEQRAAADFRGKRLLVSAAAGSGKTRLLVERVVGRIEEERLDLEDFLIITFTRAAAAELRDRFSAELGARAAESGDRHLKRQVTASKQSITTIDSLCSAIVREYSHLADIAGYRIASEGELERMRAEALAASLERIYESKDSDIREMCDAFSYGRADRKLSDAVSRMYDRMRSHPFPEEWAARVIQEYENEDFGATGFGAELSASVERILRGGVMLLEKAAALLEDDAQLLGAYGPAIESDRACADGALAALNVHDLVSAAELLTSGDARLGSVRGRGDDPLKERVKALRDAWKASKKRAAGLLAGSEDCSGELAELKNAVKGLVKAAGIFGEEFARVKALRRAAEFDDYAHAAVKLLASPLPDGGYAPSDIARAIGSRYKEILVDEFQDTTEIQTFICDLLTAEEGHALFMVGDVKQSIYRFRLARPEIFLQRYHEYPPVEEGSENARQSLTQNFRSRAEVLEPVNYFFRRLMNGGAAEIEYDEKQRLYPSREDGPDEAFSTELCIVGAEGDDEEDSVTSADAYAAEAAYVASRIKEMLDGGLLIPDGEGGTRPPRPEDIAVLLRAAGGRAWMYRQALENLGIPCGSAGENGVSAELLTLLSVLTAVDNPYLDVPLVGAMMSLVFGFSADEVALIRASAKEERSIYGAVLRSAENGNERAAEFISHLETLRREAGKTSPDRFLLYLYAETGIVGIYSALLGGAARRERLNLVYMKARAYSSESRGGLHGFIEYLEGAIERGEIASVGNESGVRIMSVHKSKGLEFAVVFCSALATRFNFDDTRGDVLIHPDLGVGLKVYDRERRYVYPSGAWSAISERMKRETLAEELRILYVAMTRAREKLILTCAFGDVEKKLTKLLGSGYLGEASFVSALTPAEWLIKLAAEHPDGSELRAVADSGDIDTNAEGHIQVRLVNMKRPDGSVYGAFEASKEDTPPDEALVEEIGRRLAFRYPEAGLDEIPSKLTATQLRGLRGYDEEEDEPSREEGPSAEKFVFSSKRPRLISGSTALTPTERGTAIHTVIQFARFEELSIREGALGEVDRLLKERFVTAEQASAVRNEVDKLCAFANSDLCRRALNSAKLTREFKFSILDDAYRYFPAAPEGEKVLLQGVCDMFFEEAGALTVVDFKSDRVSASNEVTHAQGYAPQLDAYARALERIFGIPVKRKVIWFFATGHEVELQAP